MSRIRANQITNKAATGAPTVQNGLVVTGVTTSTSFSGSGANLTSLPAQATIANNADNRVITGGSGVNLNGESNFTYDGTFGAINGNTAGLAVGTNAMVSGRADNALHLHKASSGTADGPTIYFTNQQTGVTANDGLTIGLNDSQSPYFWNRENTATRFGTNNAERLRIGSAGQIGLGGANYGTSGQVLTSQGGSAAPQWATPAGGSGRILQIVSSFSNTAYTTTSSSFQTTNLSCSITTGSAASKIYVVAHPFVGARGQNGQNAYMQCQLLRDTTHLRYQFSGGWMGNLSSINYWQHYETVSMPYIDTGVSASTTYAYKIKYRIYTQTIQAQINPHTESGNGGSYIVAMEIAT